MLRWLTHQIIESISVPIIVLSSCDLIQKDLLLKAKAFLLLEELGDIVIALRVFGRNVLGDALLDLVVVVLHHI